MIERNEPKTGIRVDAYVPCIFLLWNLGDPSTVFLMEFSLLLQCAVDGDPGGVGSSWSVSFVPGWGWAAPPPAEGPPAVPSPPCCCGDGWCIGDRRLNLGDGTGLSGATSALPPPAADGAPGPAAAELIVELLLAKLETTEEPLNCRRRLLEGADRKL